MPTITLTTTMTRPPESPNNRLHWSATNRIRREVRWELMVRARGAGAPTGLDHVTVTVHHRPADSRGIWDDDNRLAGCKAIFDALHGHSGRDTGPAWPIVADDSPDHMTQRAVGHPPAKSQPAALWVELTWTATDEEDILC
ncbi:hypothetical protein ACXYTP_07395 [Tsukamurella ocularis]|uniref:hypothetical protein n=1 Tax=Tsukamurella ocularis TaxID=1970234 RepID=UPI0039EF781D